MRFITLTKIDSDRSGHNPNREFVDTDDVDENQNVGGFSTAPLIETRKVVVNVACIRCFYTRNDNRPGTRITFNDGGGFAVTELFDDVVLAVAEPPVVGAS